MLLELDIFTKYKQDCNTYLTKVLKKFYHFRAIFTEHLNY